MLGTWTNSAPLIVMDECRKSYYIKQQKTHSQAVHLCQRHELNCAPEAVDNLQKRTLTLQTLFQLV